MSTPDKKIESLKERSERLEREAAEGKFDPAGNPLPADETDDASASAQENENSGPDNQQSDENSDGADPPITEDNYESAADAYEEASAGQQGPSDVLVATLQTELDQTKDKMMRVVADAENTKRRVMKELSDTKKYAISNFAKDMLNVADNLRRALDAVPDDVKEDARVQNLVEGIEATERELLRSFEKNGIQKLEPLDQKFDPNYHEVMFETPMPDKEHGTVIQVMETGYILQGRLLRPARVGVAKNEGGNGSDHPGDRLDTQA